jgi:hypothetical protein
VAEIFKAVQSSRTVSREQTELNFGEGKCEVVNDIGELTTPHAAPDIGELTTPHRRKR